MPTRCEYHCYTDGACKAADGAVRHQATGPAKVTEYRAVAEALLALPPGASATVFSDNLPLIENMQRNRVCRTPGSRGAQAQTLTSPNSVDSTEPAALLIRQRVS